MSLIAGTFSPPLGVALRRLEHVEFLVDTPGPVSVTHADGSTEEVYDGSEFADAYAPSSSLRSVIGGYRFVVRRVGGWPTAQVRIDVSPVEPPTSSDLVVIL